VAWFSNGDEMLGTSVEQFVRSGCDSLVFIGNGIEAGVVVEAMSKQEKPIPIFAHWALVGGNFWGSKQHYLKNVDLRFAQSILVDESASLHPKLPDFLHHYRQRYGLGPKDNIPSLIGSIHAYDATQLIAQAVAQAGSGDREAIRHAMENLRPYNGIMKYYRPAFSSTSHDALVGAQLHLGRFDDRGRIVPAE